jgi:hypothetical protein
LTETTEPAAGSQPAAGATSRGLWRNADFLRFWAGETLSLFGLQITLLALPLTALYTLDAGPEQVGLLRALQLAPYPMFALLFGVWIDRVRRRPVLLTANAVRMVLIGLVPLLAFTGQLSLSPLYVITFMVGVAAVLFDVTWMSYVPTLIKDSRYLVEANSKLGVSWSSAEAAGPSVAGVLVSVFTAPYAMVANSITYLVSLISLLMIRTREPRVAAPAQRRLRTELMDGLRWVFGHEYLRQLALAGFACNFTTIAVGTMFVVYAVQERGISALALGFILGAGAAGGILGAGLARGLVSRLSFGRAYLLGFSLVFLGPFAIPLARGPMISVFVMYSATFLFIYSGLGVVNVLVLSLRQIVTPSGMMGRMNAAMRTVLFGGGALGGPISGLVAGAVGLRTALWSLAIGSALMLVPVARSSVSALREMPASPAESSVTT